MKQTLSRAIGVLLLVSLLTGCSPIVDDTVETISLYATFYPVYALAQMIVEDVPDLTLNCLVQPQDGCLRSYSLSDWDIYLLAYSADGVIMGGCGLESFEDTLALFGASEFSVAEVLYGLDLIESEASSDDEEDSHWSGANPHLYMSLSGAMSILENIAGSMSVLDAKYSDLYMENMEAALQELRALQEELAALTVHCEGVRTALLNEALVYVADDYGLDVVAEIHRESGAALYGSELDSCLQRLQSSGTELVLIEQQAPKTLVDALDDAGFAVAKIDILSTHSEEDGAQTYFDVQRSNAQAVSDACHPAASGGAK